MGFVAGVVNAWTWAGGSFVTKGDEINLLVKPGLVAMTADGQLTSVDDLDDPSNTQHHLADVVRLCSLLRPSLRAQYPQYPFGTVTAPQSAAKYDCGSFANAGHGGTVMLTPALRRFPVSVLKRSLQGEARVRLCLHVRRRMDACPHRWHACLAHVAL
jgi:hypothetical protein